MKWLRGRQRSGVDGREEPWVAGPAADGRRRRRWAVAVVVVAVASAIGGAIVGSRLKSPADAANDRAAPAASRITVAVEERTLSATLTLAGEITFREPTPIALAGAVDLAEGDTALITRPPVVDQPVVEGDPLLEVSGRPVFVLQGALPMYRSIGPGAVGTDVAQLEAALQRLGFGPASVDDVYDEETERAVDALYAARGYRSAGPSAEDEERLTGLREAVRVADTAVRDAARVLASAGEGTAGSDLLEARQAVDAARAGVPNARATAARADEGARDEVAAAEAGWTAAATTRDRARTALATARTPGAVDPETGEPFSPSAVAERQAAVDEAEAAVVVVAGTALSSSRRTAADTAQQGRTDVQAALDTLALAEARLAEANEAPETAAEVAQYDAANIQLWDAAVALHDAEAEIGTRVPAGELVFVAALPLTVTEVAATSGGPATGVLATVSTAETEVVGRVARADADLVAEGAPVVIELRDGDEEFAGTITYVGPPRPQATGAGPEEDSAASGEQQDQGSARREVVVAPSDPGAISEFVFSSVRIRLDVGSTSGEVLVVPVAAVTVAGDGRSRVEVELAPVSATSAGRTELVDVEVGLTAQAVPERVMIETVLGAGGLIAEQAPVALNPNAPEALAATAPSAPTRARDEVREDVNGLFLLLGVISLVVGAIGIANVTLVTVMERTGEIGLRRAVGARRRHIGAQFLCESAAIGLVGGIIGASAGIVVVVAVSAARDWTPLLDPWLPFAAPLAGALVGLLAGLYPSIRAARMEPVDALRSGL